MENLINCVCILHGGIMPVYKTKGAACADVAVPERVIIRAGECVKIDLKISFVCKPNTHIKMYPRSSLMIKKCLLMPTSIIDEDYRGNVHVPLYNFGMFDVVLEKGERVAQIECVPTFKCVTWNFEDNPRSSDGFGGTGAI